MRVSAADAFRSGPLPVDAVLGELSAALGRAGAAVLAAPAGSGKSTHVPLALAEAPWLTAPRVLVLEPRRLAARAVARRMASLLGEAVGGRVGYRMRGETRVSGATVIEVVTDGVLTRLLQRDPALAGVGAVVFDEFHERSLDADLGLALCLESRAALRPDLRLLVMSATLDTAPVAQLLGSAGAGMGPAPLIETSGRQYPVEVRWAPAGGAERLEVAVARLVRRALAEVTSGDVLVFLPGAGEIGRTAAVLAGTRQSAGMGQSRPGGTVVLPLHGRLPPAEQDRALAPDTAGRRKVVLATSIAETSLTIEGVTVVVDAGLARVARFDPRRGVGGLHTRRVSRAAAEQRRGRAGRLGPGSCYRLWAEADHARLPVADPPEILAADLAPLALHLAAWGDPTGAGLAWLDPPPAPVLLAATELLARLGLVDDRGRPTAHGRAVHELGLHPRLGHAVVRAAGSGDGRLACDLAALLGERDGGAGQQSRSDSGDRRSADLRERLGVVSRPGRAKDEAMRLRRRVGVGGRPGDAHAGDAGAVLALGWPERVARRREGAGGRYLLASGLGAAVAPTDPLAASPLLAVVDLDMAPGGGDARIRLAAPLEEADLPGPVTEVDVVAWDDRAGDVRARRERRFGALVLASSPLAAASTGAGAEVAALVEGVRSGGLGMLSWPDGLLAWRHRVAFLRRELGEPWPDLGDEALLEDLAGWLGPALMAVGARRRADLARVDTRAALASRLAWPLPARLDELAPASLVVPSGRRARVDYAGEHPVLAVRLQECFGWTATPRVAEGRVPVVVHLLSPAGRPLAVTADLASFWSGAYPQVRGEMRGRYPRHPWPEDPLTFPPGRPPRPRR